MPYPVFDDDACIGCGICTDECPQKVIVVEDGKATAENQEDCVGCGACQLACPLEAITEIVEDDD